MSIEKHNPGGRSTFALEPHVTSAGANFSDCGRFRYSLHRTSKDLAKGDGAIILFIGLNPSTADGNLDDPTCRREGDFARALGFTTYLKANIFPYRATSPRDLATSPLRRHEWLAALNRNAAEIERLAKTAERIVLAFGRLPSGLPPFLSGATGIALEAASRGSAKFECFGVNADGSPKHPLYLPKTSTLRPWPGFRDLDRDRGGG